MKKLLSALLALCMLLSMYGALADITQEDIDTPYDPPINLTAWRFLSSAIQLRRHPDPVRVSFPAKIFYDGLDHGVGKGINWVYW